MKKITCK